MNTRTIKTIDQELAQLEAGNDDVRIELLRERNRLSGDLDISATDQELEEDNLRRKRFSPEDRAEIWLRAAPFEYEELYNSYMFRPGEWSTTYNSADNLVTELEWIAVKASAIAAYVGTRAGLDGCGKGEHADAVKVVNKLYKKIRGLFGYTPKLQGDYIR